MQREIPNIVAPADFRINAAYGLAIAVLLILTPFSINNFMQGRVLLGAGSLAIIVAVASNAWLTKHGALHDALAGFILVPAILFFLSVSIRNQGIVGVLWSFPALSSLYILLPERKAWIANGLLLLLVLPQTWLALDAPLAFRAGAALIAVTAFSAIFVHAIASAQLKFQRMAATDPLTGLYNRVLLDEFLGQAREQSQRSDMPMSLLAIDLDHLKLLNDQFGHAAGDRALVQLAEQLRGRFRRVDNAFRMGGDEFLVLLYDSDSEAAARLAEEFRQLVESSPLSDGRKITVSIGAATLQPEEELDSWMQRADASLYAAKAAGRNCVTSSDSGARLELDTSDLEPREVRRPALDE